MDGFDVLHVKSAIQARNKIKLHNTHLTTGDFGQVLCLKCQETIPGGDYPLDATFFCRTAPLVKPTYGKFAFKTVNAFVPFHQVAYDADAYTDGKTVFEGQIPLPRYFTIYNLAVFVINYCCTSTGASATNSQLTYTGSDGTVYYRLFTNVGRYYVKILNQLGYAIPEGIDLQTSSVWYTDVAPTKLNAYPFLSFLKLYNDYMSQSQRFNTSVLSNALLCIKYNKTLSGYTPTSGQISHQLISSLLAEVKVNYVNDYFTSAWSSPNSPLITLEHIDNVSVPGTPAIIRDTNTNTTAFQTSVVTPPLTEFSQRTVDLMRRFDNWVRRNNFAGSRVCQERYARWGIKSDDYKSHYAEVLSTEIMPIQVGDVTATADSTGVPLGDYAGKAIMSGDKGVRYKASDRGYLFVLGFFTVEPMMAYGYDRQVLRVAPFDFYTPEFDGMGAEAISVGEVFTNPIGQNGLYDTDVFGFTERYNSYRYSRDQITGDFRDYRANGDMNCWHSGRNLEALRSAGILSAQSSSMNTMPQTDSEYNRIFSVTSGDVDHFYLTCQFRCDAILPIKNLNQVADLGEGDTTVPRNGNVIS